MVRANGKITGKAVERWFNSMGYAEQKTVLDTLNAAHGRARDGRIRELQDELAALQNGHGDNGVLQKTRNVYNGAKKDKRRNKAKVKFRDPKTGNTWSGRGRMAGWLAVKVKSGEKADKYLA